MGDVVTRPLVRYHGGKWNLGEWILPFFPKHRTYCEPFSGGASLLLQKARTYAEVYNDLDEYIVNLFRVVRDHGLDLHEKIFMTPFSRKEFEQAYFDSPDPIEQARRTFVRFQMSFGATSTHKDETTGFRSQSDQKTSPARDWMNHSKTVLQVMERLRGVIIECMPATKLIEKYDGEDTLFYVDPPYIAHTRKWRRGKGSYRHEMTDEQHMNLILQLKSLKGMVILSGYPNKMYDEFLPDWRRETKAAFTNGGGKSIECLWISPNTPVHGYLNFGG